jgi:hypothetical protein
MAFGKRFSLQGSYRALDIIMKPVKKRAYLMFTSWKEDITIFLSLGISVMEKKEAHGSSSTEMGM